MKSHRFIFLSLFAGVAFSNNLLSAELNSKVKLTNEANKIVKRFAGELKPKLKFAIQDKGFLEAVNICAEQAPLIAKKLEISTGWSIKRVSLKARNVNAEPDDYERTILTQFNDNLSDNELLISAEFISDKFRFLKAQKVDGICLNCHGENITPDILSAINKHYPTDNATGYKLGDIRGAFSLSKKLESHR